MKKATRFYCEDCGLSDTVFYTEDEGAHAVIDRICSRHGYLSRVMGLGCPDARHVRVEVLGLVEPYHPT